ncbi:MAG: site-2 protease family protein [Acetobacteraceae bacterium]
MNLHIVLIIFQIVVLLFAISLHEAAHGWMAWRLGDPTARMLGRVTLNPIRHIDPFGTILIPLLCLYAHFPLIGWAKPTPVTTRNFKRLKRDDILTTLAGPASNLLLAIAALIVLLFLKAFDPTTVLTAIVSAQMGVASQIAMNGSPVLFPVTMLLYYAVLLNLMLMAFNLIPLPPLDGSHVVRHMLPYNWLRAYDSIGIVGLILIFFFGGGFIYGIVRPFMMVFNHVLLNM